MPAVCKGAACCALAWHDGSLRVLEHLKMATEVASPNIAKIHLTERAAAKIRALLEKDGVSPDVGGLRVGVQGGGCSGLSYAMRLDTQARDRDKIFEEFGARNCGCGSSFTA